LVLYFVASLYEWAASDSIIKHTVKCRYCRKRISEKVSLLFFFFLVPGWEGGVVRGRGLFANSCIVGSAVCELYELAGWERGCSVILRVHGFLLLYIKEQMKPCYGDIRFAKCLFCIFQSFVPCTNIISSFNNPKGRGTVRHGSFGTSTSKMSYGT